MSGTVAVERPKVAPLESGDHLTQPEFHARYLATPRIKKAELIEGIVFMPSPVSDLHSGAHSKIIGWLENYASRDPTLAVRVTPTLILDDRNEYQPDAVLRRGRPASEVQHTEGTGAPSALSPASPASPSLSSPASYVDAEGYLRGAPELVVEIAVTSAAIDLHEKREVYRRKGVTEYLVWQVLDEAITWWGLTGGRFEPFEPSDAEVLESRIFPGLRLNKPALLRGDMAAVLKTLDHTN